MRLLADECCDTGLVYALRNDGHDVRYAMESMRGANDEDILQQALNEQRILLTEDKDFGELVYRLKLPAFGIVLLRFANYQHDLKIQRLRTLFAHQPERLENAFVVLEADKMRISPLS